jgi:hypothetical protein
MRSTAAATISAHGPTAAAGLEQDFASGPHRKRRERDDGTRDIVFVDLLVSCDGASSADECGSVRVDRLCTKKPS